MRGLHDARAVRRAGALTSLALLALAGASRVEAQADVPLGVRRVIGSPVRPLRAVGDAALCRAMDCERTASGALELAPSARWWITAEGTIGRSVVQPASPLSTDVRVDLFYGSAERQLWIGRGAARARGLDSLGSGQNRWLEYGVAARWRAVSVAVDFGVGSQPIGGNVAQTPERKVIQVVDSMTGVVRVDTVLLLGTGDERTRWRSTAFRLGWRSDAWRLGTMLGRASSSTGRPIVWSTTEAERRLGSSLGIVASIGTYPGSLATTAASTPRARWMFGAGITIATGRRAHDVSPPADAAPSVEQFAAVRLSSERYRIVVHFPGAARVELASDLTGWVPVVMLRGTGDTWSAEVPASSGVHRVSFRIDGGTWIAPPGLVAEDDGFGGSAGMVVIP